MNDKEIEARFKKQDIINGRVSSRLFMIDDQLNIILESIETLTVVTSKQREQIKILKSKMMKVV